MVRESIGDPGFSFFGRTRRDFYAAAGATGRYGFRSGDMLGLSPLPRGYNKALYLCAV